MNLDRGWIHLGAALLCALWVNGLPARAAGADAAGSRASGTEWQSLFDGKSLTGWRGYGMTAMPAQGWRAEDGVLKKVGGERGGDIITTRVFTDFEFSWEWRVLPGGNNGVKYLVTEKRPDARGHEYQMIDDLKHPDAARGSKRMTASFYDVLPPSAGTAAKPAGEWNESRIRVLGNHVEHWLNGRKVLEYELGSDALKKAIGESKFKTAPGFGEKIAGPIMLTDHGDECWFRNLKIRELGKPAP